MIVANQDELTALEAVGAVTVEFFQSTLVEDQGILEILLIYLA